MWVYIIKEMLENFPGLSIREREREEAEVWWWPSFRGNESAGLW